MQKAKLTHLSQCCICAKIDTLFLTNFQTEADCLSVNSLIDRDPKLLFFMS